jgi:hypothetical protein
MNKYSNRTNLYFISDRIKESFEIKFNNDKDKILLSTRLEI